MVSPSNKKKEIAVSDSWGFPLARASDTQLREALQHAHIPALMCALAHWTGDNSHFTKVKPLFDPFAEEEDGLQEEDREQARELAYQVLAGMRGSAAASVSELDDSLVTQAMHYITGEPFDDGLESFLREELNLYGEDRRELPIDTSAMSEDYRVIIIGSGMSGIVMAVRLLQQGIPFLILEKNPEMTGTWYENTYPGCQVDSVNHLYNYIFEPNSQWSNHFSGAAELYSYFQRVIEKYGLRDHTRLNCAVMEAKYLEADNRWVVTVDNNGVTEQLDAAVVVSAVGQLNKPKFPDIAGLGDFDGVSFHSSRWEHQHDLTGKRVAVIGTGCSAVQFVPEIAPQCQSLTVFQRTPCWLFPAPEYHVPMTEEELWLFRELPFYSRWYRFFLFRTRAVDGYLAMMISEPGWSGENATISEYNALLREALIEYVREQVDGDTALMENLIPDYPPGGKWPVMDDGSWVKALRRDNVELCVDGIREVVADGVITVDGQFHPIDVLIFGTGFEADQFLVPMKVVGREGVDLVDTWGGDPQAYKGVLVSGYPNFYCLYGPNTNIVVGSSIVFYVECQVRYLLGCLKLQLETNIPVIECRADVQASYNKSIDRLNSERAWGSPLVDSWYKNSAGRVTQNWPGTHYEFWEQMQQPELAEFLEGNKV
jgi:4-hydroxyacetophenone monooxygenase